MDYGIKCVTVCACDWLLFVFFYLYILYAMSYVFNYFKMLRCTQPALSRQRYSLSSCTLQTLSCKLQGTAHGHIPLPKRKYQPVCHLKPMDCQNHPKVKRTCSTVHNNHYPVTRHGELKIRAD
jgi:hypothetical protein